jgi:hypothetical protein
MTLLYDGEEDILVVKEDPQSRFFREGVNLSETTFAALPESPIYNTAAVRLHVKEAMTDVSGLVKDVQDSRNSVNLETPVNRLDSYVKDEIRYMSVQVLPLPWEPFREEYLSALSSYGAATGTFMEARRFDAYSPRWQSEMRDASQFLDHGDEGMGTAASKLPGGVPAPASTLKITPAGPVQGTVAGDLELVSDSMTLDSQGYGSITGTVVNHGARRYLGVKVVPHLYNSKGSMIGITMDTTDEIAPYGSWNFTASVFIPDVASYKNTEVEYTSFTI